MNSAGAATGGRSDNFCDGCHRAGGKYCHDLENSFFVSGFHSVKQLLLSQFVRHSAKNMSCPSLHTVNSWTERENPPNSFPAKSAGRSQLILSWQTAVLTLLLFGLAVGSAAAASSDPKYLYDGGESDSLLVPGEYCL